VGYAQDVGDTLVMLEEVSVHDVVLAVLAMANKTNLGNQANRTNAKAALLKSTTTPRLAYAWASTDPHPEYWRYL
jgi:hypothetical protein